MSIVINPNASAASTINFTCTRADGGTYMLGQSAVLTTTSNAVSFQNTDGTLETINASGPWVFGALAPSFAGDLDILDVGYQILTATYSGLVGYDAGSLNPTPMSSSFGMATAVNFPDLRVIYSSSGSGLLSTTSKLLQLNYPELRAILGGFILSCTGSSVLTTISMPKLIIWQGSLTF